jgi:uncharacterized protein (DUF302 family)
MNRFITSLFLAWAVAGSAAAIASPASTPTPAIVIEDVSKGDFATTLATVREQLNTDGWNLVAEVNLGERLAKRGVNIPGGLVILELTSGKHAVPLLKADDTRYVSALMPCSVSIYGLSDGRVKVARMNAGLLAGMLEPRVAEVMAKSAGLLDESIARALAKLSP